MDSIASPTHLKYTPAMIIERLSTHGSPQEPSQWIKTTTAGATIGRLLPFSSGLVRSYFGMNWQDAVVLLPSKALK